MPQFMLDPQRKMLEAAARACQSEKFVTPLSYNPEDIDGIVGNMLKAHKAGKAAIKPLVAICLSD
jgi:hypothetical protein